MVGWLLEQEHTWRWEGNKKLGSSRWRRCQVVAGSRWPFEGTWVVNDDVKAGRESQMVLAGSVQVAT